MGWGEYGMRVEGEGDKSEGGQGWSDGVSAMEVELKSQMYTQYLATKQAG